MTRHSSSVIVLCTGFLLLLVADAKPSAQQNSSPLRVDVNLVQLNVAVTDRHGNYISGLKPENFRITEDNISEKIASFEEGNGSGTFYRLDDSGGTPSGEAGPPANSPAVLTANADHRTGRPIQATTDNQILPNPGASIFILFDTSDYMYRGFVYAQDAITEFVRSLDNSNRIAFYSYSRNLSRDTLLTSDRFRVIRGVRSTVAGDQAALYNSLLLTVKDASHLTGRKAIVVFSNGPDNASSVPPEDVAELAQSTGTIIYIVSTRKAENEPISTAAFERVSRATGGMAYFARNWNEETQAFAAIRKDIAHLYTISYYPQMNPNQGWRTIHVKLVGPRMNKYHIRTRDGYRLRQFEANTTASYFVPEPAAR